MKLHADNFNCAPTIPFYNQSIKKKHPVLIDVHLFLVFVEIHSILFQSFEFTSEDLKDLGEMGRGNYGFVNKMIHEKSGTIMAVKVIFLKFENIFKIPLNLLLSVTLFNLKNT